MKTASELRHDVLTELEWEPSVDETAIHVAVSAGVVTLAGRIPSYSASRAAVRAAKRVEGVQGVANELTVDLPNGARREDAAIAEAAARALKWHTRVPEESVKPVVRDGWITLEGEVDRGFQKEMAFRAVCDLTGVKGVVNQISVRPLATAAEVRGKIAEALHRSATVDARGIAVRAVGDRVVLSGTVRSWAESEDAERSAWSAPGVRHVENRLRVQPRVSGLLGPGERSSAYRMGGAGAHDMADAYSSIAL